MTQITVDELTSELLKLTKLKPKEALRFVSAISGSLDHELSQRAADPELVPISIPDKENVFTLGIVPENTLIDSVYASTGLPRQDVRAYLGFLDKSLRPRLRYLKEPVDLEGFGRITQQGGRLTYEPVAFQHLRRS
jgi:nucleoid DNA-binding protein